MFDAVLVANRGEIALRIYRTCADLGVRSVAVYSEADREAPWLDAADDAYLVGPAAASRSYLDVERIIEAAERAGADAVHPGYGFLSERADAARAITDAGLVWIGPPADAIERMGDKLSARRSATAAGCPVVPGTDEPTEDVDVVREFVARHGLPVAIKAAFGGGGRGLKVVRHEADLADALESASREATASFGRGEVYVERYLPRPRHIEVQVLADAHGTVLHLGERDCSSQRRHQKLIEEAPAPGLDPALRRAMGDAAVKVSREVDYVGAGTCEFLFADGTFWFLEMNTRLQVEHPVTEIVTGVDLVAWQLRIAAGEPLDFGQGDVRTRGHAIEARVNAEDVAAGFAPTGGRITRWVAPSGPGVRVDAATAGPWTMPQAYDSLIAKVIGYGADRDSARRALLRACREMVVEGVPTTLDFHRFALEHDDFVAGAVSTVSVEREWDLSSISAADRSAPHAVGTDDHAPPPPPVPVPVPVIVEVDGRRVEVVVHDRSAGARDARPRRRSSRSTRATARPGAVVAPMQGTIVKLHVEVGQPVAAGDALLVLEAMKMENALTAQADGVVAAVHASVGQVVDAGDVLVEVTGAPDGV